MPVDARQISPGNWLDCLRSPQQHTLNTSFCRTGVGLHTGKTTQVRVLPAAVNQGRFFRRTDLETGTVLIPAHTIALRPTPLSTALGSAEAGVQTVEHLLATLFGMGIDNACIEIDGPEVPLLDGSAQPWMEAIMEVGWQAQPGLRSGYILPQPVWVQQSDAYAIALPAPETRLTYGIDFAISAIGQQWQSMGLPDFVQDIAPARTFGLAAQVEQLRDQGLIKGGSLENALICDRSGWLNPPLRFENEPVRHKLLDFLGDLSLIGYLPRAHYLAYKASHALHTELARRLALMVQSSP